MSRLVFIYEGNCLHPAGFFLLFFDWAKEMGLDRGIFGWNITKMMETYGRDAGQEKENDPRQRLDV
jgi:hypothetical protein